MINPNKYDGVTMCGFAGISQDKNGQCEYQQQLLKFSQAIEQSHEIIIFTDSQGYIEYVNPSYQVLTGFDPQDAIGQHLLQKYSHDLSTQAQLKAALQYHNYWQGEIRQTLPDGTNRIFRATLSPLHDIDQHLNGFLLRKEDVTEIVRLVETEKAHAQKLENHVAERIAALDQAKQQAELLAKVKSEFLANMSHEIRTPMNAILGITQILCKMELPAEAAELAKKIQTSGELLLGIINEILDFSKIEAGKIDIEYAPFYLGNVLDNLAMVMNTAAVGKGLELSISPPPSSACFLIGDALRIGQVLINLVSNAIKFTHKGIVQVKITELDSDSHSVRLHFCVCDTGIGMDETTQAKLFEPFMQADNSTTRRYGGSGLGLVITRRLLAMMGTQLELHSEQDKGSSFSFNLTLDKQESGKERINQPLNLNILVADDNEISLQGLAATLKTIGWWPELFTTGKSLLQRVMADPSLQSPQTVLLLDWKMPDLNGIELMQQLHAQLPEKQRPISLLITAHTTTQLFEEQVATGLIDGVLAKPVGPSMLYNGIIKARNRHSGILPPQKIDISEKRLMGLRFLIVDDSDVNLEVSEHLFNMEGAQVIKAMNGKQAVDWLAAHPSEVDMVLMDIHMPVMDGLEATRRIRQLPNTRQLPIVALTAGVVKEQQEAIFAAGMNSFIPKPFVLDKVINQILALLRPVTETAKLENTEPTITTLDNADSTLAETVLLNSSYGEKLFKKPEIYTRYLHQFTEQYQSIPEQIASGTIEAKQLEALAHKLRGSAGNLGLDKIATIATRLETRLLQGQKSSSDALKLRDALLQSFQAITDYIAYFNECQKSAVSANSIPLPQQAWDCETVSSLFAEILSNLQDSTPEPVETALVKLQAFLEPEQLKDIYKSIANFDFDEAETNLRLLAEQLNIILET